MRPLKRSHFGYKDFTGSKQKDEENAAYEHKLRKPERLR